jgi:hypothetical protein
MNWKFVGIVLLLVFGTLYPAYAGVIINVVESDGDVVATATGSIDVSSLTLVSSTSGGGHLIWGDYPGGSAFITGHSNNVVGSVYAITGPSPSNFITSTGYTQASYGSGLVIGVLGGNRLYIANGAYVSGDPITSSATWENKTFEDLGLQVGSYIFSWGSGETADTLTINVLMSDSPAPVPEPTTTALFSVGGLGLLLIRRLRRA